MAKKVTFELKIERLDEIVRQLEEGKLDLDASLKLYTEGVKLSQDCGKELENARLKVAMLVEENGEMTTQPFEAE